VIGSAHRPVSTSSPDAQKLYDQGLAQAYGFNFPSARAAAEASACAYRQKNDYFWDFHDFFFDHQRELTPGNLRARVLEHAGTIPGLDRATFESCLANAKAKTAIEREVAFGNDQTKSLTAPSRRPAP
jgi:protein-disulfide isomerase